MRYLVLFLLGWGSLAASADEVLEYWFGDTNEPRAELWFRGGEEIDAEIKERFGVLVEKAANGELNEWTETARGKLALIVVLDQFSRHVYRGTPRAYAQDEQARSVALSMVQEGEDYLLSPLERAFVYLPFEHAEDRYFQERSVDCFEKLQSWAPAHQQELFGNFLAYAEEHRDTIFRYGRFPYRNAVLGRKSSSSELSYLQSH